MSNAKALLPSTKARESLDGIFGEVIRPRFDCATLAEDVPPQADSRIEREMRVENSRTRLELFIGSPRVGHFYDAARDIMFHFLANTYALLVATSTSGFGSRTRVSFNSNPASFNQFSISSG